MPQGISDAGLVHQLRYRFGLRGPSAEVGVSELISPVVNLGDLDQAPWHAKGSGHWGGTLAATAAQLNYIGLRAPLTLPSNYRAVIRAAGLATTGQFGAFLKVSNSASLDATIPAPTLAGIAGSWDSHPDGDPPVRTPLQAYALTSATVVGGDGMLQKCGSTNNMQFFPSGLVWVLAPGNTLYWQADTVNAALVAAFYWDEYYIG